MIGAVFRLDCSGISGLVMVRQREVRARAELVMAPLQLVITIHKSIRANPNLVIPIKKRASSLVEALELDNAPD